MKRPPNILLKHLYWMTHVNWMKYKRNFQKIKDPDPTTEQLKAFKAQVKLRLGGETWDLGKASKKGPGVTDLRPWEGLQIQMNRMLDLRPFLPTPSLRSWWHERRVKGCNLKIGCSDFFVFSFNLKLSSPGAESARAVTGSRCPYSGVGEDFLVRRTGPLTKVSVTRKRKVAQ